eukprot:47363_1
MSPASFVEVGVDVAKWTTYAYGFIVTGYIKSERKRILLTSSNCVHLNFKDLNRKNPHKYVADILSTIFTKRKTLSRDQIIYIRHLYGDGICQTCALYVFEKLINILNQKINVLTDNISESSIPFELLSLLNSLVLQHYHICLYIFKHTNIWKQIFVIFTELLRVISQLTEINETTYWLFDSFFALGLQIIRHLYLLETNKNSIDNQRKWRFIINKYHSLWIKIGCQCFKNSLYTKMDTGNECMFILIILLLRCYYFYKRFGHTSPFIETFYQHLCPYDPNLTILDLNLLYIKYDYVEGFRKMQKWFEIAKAAKWNNMKCDNPKCLVTRNLKDLYRCKGCKLVRYCSKHCQKRSWMCHKIICFEIQMK